MGGVSVVLFHDPSANLISHYPYNTILITYLVADLGWSLDATAGDSDH